ncbi:transporter substrate-binding domain-containing protein, partial [Roseibium sp. SCP14]|uniref:transporter substrate-binding domain-containing protein n=1 Tax=Roseibium sp. SCP14 TaxID=3141375 RepID=UPI00333C5568
MLKATGTYLAKAAVVSGLALAGALSGPAHASDKLDELRAAGTAKIAIANEPPYSSIDGEGNIGGAAPDVARAVLNELGIQNVEAVVVDYGAMIPGLLAGRF